MSVALAQQYLEEEAQALRRQYQIDSQKTFELRLEFETPLMVSAFKADVPVPGLPNLDGILQFASFYWCVRHATGNYPELATDYLWQVNYALKGRNWIDFPIPLRRLQIGQAGAGRPHYLYDCSVGLPVDGTPRSIFYPMGSEFLNERGERLRRVIDSIPLRRRIIDPAKSYVAVELMGQKLDTSRGAYKALDNRMYNSTVTEYGFIFRGDPIWIERLLETMRSDGVGIGKKSSLGYGQIRQIMVMPSVAERSTLGYKLSPAQAGALNVNPTTPVITLLKNVPSDELFRWSADPVTDREQFLAAKQVKILSIIPQLAGYIPPNWLKTNQTVVARYGSLLYEVA